MSLVMLTRADIDREKWDGLVSGSPDGWVFSLYGWQELILAVADWCLEDFSFGVVESGRLVAVVPLQFDPRSGRMASSGWGGSGPVIATGVRLQDHARIVRVALDHCLHQAQVCQASVLEMSCSPVTGTATENRWGVNPFLFYGYEDISILSQVVDLRRSEEELWNDLSGDARRQIRKAEQAGTTVDRVVWADSLEDYYRLHQETYRRTHVTPHPFAYFQGIAHAMGAMGHSVLWRACAFDGTILAYHNSAWFNRGGYYHTGCSVEHVAEQGAGYLLFWKALLGAKEAGLWWYDCGAIFPNATDAKQKGLTTFKTKFGGEAHRAFQAKRGLTPPANLVSANTSLATVPAKMLAAEFVKRISRGVLCFREKN